MPYRMKGKKVYFTRCPTRTGSKVVTTGSRDKSTARGIERMLATLGPRGTREWDLLEAVTSKVISLGKLYDFYRVNRLDHLRALLNDVDLEPLVADWQEWLRTSSKARSPDTRQHYLTHVRTLIPTGIPTLISNITPAACERWLTDLKVSTGTRRKYHVAAKSFFRYLRMVKITDLDPFRDIPPPPQGRPRTSFLELDEVLRLIQSCPPKLGQVFAASYGAGIEIGVVLALRVSDVNKAAKEIRAAGKKTHSRDRTVKVASWAWEYICAAMAGKLPGALLMDLPNMDRSRVTKRHKKALEGLGLHGYTLHDARHHWAVRAARAGTPVEVISRQLGHVNSVMVQKVYGVFMPNAGDRDKWERIASAHDDEYLKRSLAKLDVSI